ncbi:MAG: Acetamidase [Alectoria fallacina]|uniref:amidase n=1 Tax=Alectoria fallacina TaxID=1903189 RepID=A0A8H3EFL0_9LECA|nr:MAG: Acetamidase [Alectoria fallacina]
MATETSTWQHLAKAKVDAINGSIPEKWQLSSIPPIEEQQDVTGPFIRQFLSAEEVEITETDAIDIVEKTSVGIWTAEEVTTAFCHRASLAHQLTNCLHETFFDAAIEDAKQLDKYYAQHKAPIGPLHGLPVSLKDQFHVKGVETTMGYIGWINTFEGRRGTGKEKVFESEMVKELRLSGAVLYCKTSVPHSLMTGETVNNIIGYTTNPKNRNLTCGGSSGGEGALIAMKGSPAGFGTDIGGSIRIPAAFNGLYGLRPSAGRMPYEGMANSMDGQNSVLSVVGPLSHSVASLKLLVKSLLIQQPWLHDPLCNEIPWRQDQEDMMLHLISSSKLAFGILKHDGIITPHPPVQRALGMVVETLKTLGHEVIDWDPPSHKRGYDIIMNSWTYDGGTDIHNALGLSGEPMVSQISGMYGKKREEASASRISANNIAKRNYQKEYMEYWNSTAHMTATGRPVDAIIAPLAPFAAARPDRYKYYGYSNIYNTLDYTSCVVPVTNVDKQVDVVNESFQPVSEQDRDTQEDYDPEIYHGAHVAVQLVGRRLQEEKVLALSEYVGGAIAEAKETRSSHL